MNTLKPQTATVVEAHEPPDELPLTLSPGDVVNIVRDDPNRAGWVWANDGSISAGWVPVSVLEAPSGKTRATQEFCSQEIAVQPGQSVRLMWEGAGGWWCENEDGDRGWLSADKLQIGSNAA